MTPRWPGNALKIAPLLQRGLLDAAMRRPELVVPDLPVDSMNPEDLLKLVTTEMPFGKHQGTLIADLPGNYLGWFAREGFPKGQIGSLLALMYELDHNDLRGLLKPLRGR